MPMYEFLCQKCNARSSLLILNIAESLVAIKCPACGSSNLVRVISSFAFHKSLKTIHEEAGEPTMFSGPDYYKDPRNIGRWAEKRVKELGLDMPPQAQEMIQAARGGEMPEPLKEL